MILWRRTIGVGLGLVAASSLWTVAQAYPAQAEAVDHSFLIQVDDEIQIGEGQIEDGQIDSSIDSLATTESFTEVVPMTSDAVGQEVMNPVVAEAPAPEVTAVPPEVLANLSPAQLTAIARIIATAEQSASADRVANLPTEVLTHLDALPGIEQQVGRRRWLPTSLVRRLRLPQRVTSLIRQPRNTALVMLGNHIMVVNPVTGAVLGAVLSAL
ncbi:hypothetical protein [Nodosilinea sp. E11]|uniref:hypothetical protein n=1 Tax=Nodosilinea sp. E11 TaxID=3037479 RepID=UPI0029346DB9|nr:hypothetical protein [Nodosilinea sp. E11]WOD39126.1 hypothetical protein RRF56_23240 [Nodosilinea sp. E11]